MNWIFGLLFLITLHAKGEVATEPLAQTTAEVALVEPNKAAVRESEIPVALETTKKSAGNESPFVKIMMTFGILGILGCGAYFLIKKHVRSGVSPSQANQVKVLSQHYLGPKKSLAIIRVAGESILIGITDQNISLIKELSLLDDEVPEKTPKNFRSVFNLPNPTNTPPSVKEEDGLDEFSISGIKDFVSTKLKNMRTLE